MSESCALAISTFYLRSMGLLTVFVLIVVLLVFIRGIAAFNEDFDGNGDQWEQSDHEMNAMIVGVALLLSDRLISLDKEALP